MQEQTNSRGQRKQKSGIVVANKMDKTVVVKVKRVMRHPKFGKVIHRWRKYYAHDEGNACQIGDAVTIVETRPLSKTKCWRVAQQSA